MRRDEWVLRPGNNMPAKVEEKLGRSRVLVLCMSAKALGADWAQSEAATFGRGQLTLARPAEQGAPLLE